VSYLYISYLHKVNKINQEKNKYYIFPIVHKLHENKIHMYSRSSVSYSRFLSSPFSLKTDSFSGVITKITKSIVRVYVYNILCI